MFVRAIRKHSDNARWSLAAPIRNLSSRKKTDRKTETSIKFDKYVPKEKICQPDFYFLCAIVSKECTFFCIKKN